MKHNELLGKFYNGDALKKAIGPIIDSEKYRSDNRGIFHPGQEVEYYYIFTKNNGEKHNCTMPAIVIARELLWPNKTTYYYLAVNIIDINVNGFVEKVWIIIRTDTGLVTSTPGDTKKHALVYTLDKGVETIQTVNATNVIAFPSKKKE